MCVYDEFSQYLNVQNHSNTHAQEKKILINIKQKNLKRKILFSFIRNLGHHEIGLWIHTLALVIQAPDAGYTRVACFFRAANEVETGR